MFEFSQFGDSVAIETLEGQKITYSELQALTNDLSENIKPRTLVFILCDNTLGSVVGYLASLNTNAVPVLLEKDLAPELLRNLISIYEPAFIYMPQQNEYAPQNSKSTCEKWDYKLVQLEKTSKTMLSPELTLLLSTSGSTGSPKFVRISHENLKSNTEAIASYLKINKQDRAITGLPMNYTFGLSILNSHFIAGATILLTNKTLFDKEFWSFFKEQKATSLSGVPYMFEMLDRMRFFRSTYPSLQKMTQAGGKLKKELAEKCLQYSVDNNIEFTVMYGQTEATARISYLPFEGALRRPDSIGIPIPGGKMTLIDKSGNNIEDSDVEGELVYQGKNVALGYAKQKEDLQKGDEWKGVLHTGDLAKRDADGYFFVTGRLKRFIKMHGKRVNLDEIEKIAKSVVSECACIGSENRLEVYVVEESKIPAVKERIVDMTHIHPTTVKVKLLDEIPKNSSGKIRYSEITGAI